MGKKTPDLPTPPDPAKTIAAQGVANRENIVDLIRANRLNQETPFGSITFEGGTGPGGVFGQTQKVNLAPGIEQTLENQQGLASALSGQGLDIANAVNLGDIDTSGLPQRVGGVDLGALTPLPGSDAGERQRIEQTLFDRSRSLLDPVFADQRRQTEQTLADRGFNLERSEGATRELDRLERSQNRSLERAAADAVAFGGGEQSRAFDIASRSRGQQFGEGVTNAALADQARASGIDEEAFLRSLPLRDISQLNAAQPNLPVLQPGGFFTPNSAAPDVIGANQAAFNNQFANAQLQANTRGGIFRGISDLAGALGSAAILSDRRLKTDIEKIGEWRGLKVYQWTWNTKAYEAFGHEGRDQGLMAQDVQKVAPAAIVDRDGYMAIDYSKLVDATWH